MRPAARKSLEILARADLWLTPNNIAENVGYAPGTIRNEIPELLEDGMIVKKEGPGDPFYRITDRGRDYLEGDFDEDGPDNR